MNLAPGAWRYALGPLLASPFAFVLNPALAAALAAIGAFVLWFFRDPDRSAPPAGVVAPADGKVSVLREEGERVRLGIFMNVWNVHVVRAPTDGSVTDVEHTPGAHRPAFSKESDRNERVHVRLAETGGGTPVEEVTLIAGAFARRISPYADPDDEVRRGDRIGHIAFGSRVDVVFGPDVSIDDVAVGHGEATRAGETVVLETAHPDG